MPNGTCLNFSHELLPCPNSNINDANIILRRAPRKAAAVSDWTKFPTKQASSTGKDMPPLLLARNLVLHEL